MYLSKIEIFGFKSFAQNVNLSFDSGITAIVGPNGCGKTNIVDAIRWALGEQRYSTLRSDKMEDVIFNGTKNRKPLSMAEVSLIIENTKGILPTDYSQVTVTRRVYRSGESEYLLNKVQCRLKDILDLFMDTGMGADAYSVIELKMVETILSDKTDERRRLFEEAAGVTKYKHRRKAAFNKLQNVQQDLVRVNDIVKEVQKTVNALERQSKRAEQYNEISKNLKELEIDLLEHEYAYLFNKLQPLKEKHEETDNIKIKVDEDLTRQESLLDQMRIEISDVERQLIEIQRELAGLVSKIHKYEDINIIGNEQINSFRTNIGRYEREKIELISQKEKLEEQKVALGGKIENYRFEISKKTADYNRSSGELQILGENLKEKKDIHQNYNNEIISLIQEILNEKGEKHRLDERMENLNRIIESAKEDTEYFEDEIRKNVEKVTELTTQDKDLRRQFTATEAELYKVEDSVTKLKSEIEILQKKELELQNEVHKINAKIDFLVGLIEGQEGVGEGAKYLLTEASQETKKYVSVTDIINTEEKYRPAIQAALGEMINYLVVQKETDALEAIAQLERLGKGKAVFICLDRVPYVKSIRNESPIAHLWASQIVKVKEQYQCLVDFLLDNIIIVDKLKSVKNSLVGVKYVALDGSCQTSSGIIRGGSKKQDDGGLIGKRDQIAELELQKAKVTEEIEKIKQQQAENSKNLETLNIKKFLEEVKDIEKQMTSVEMKIAQLEFEKKRANDSIERSKLQIEHCLEEISEIKKKNESLIPHIETLEKSKNENDIKAEEIREELNRLTKEHNDLSRAVNDVEVKLVSLQGEQRNAEIELERDDLTIKNIDVTLQKREEDVEQAKSEINRISLEIESSNTQLGETREVLNKIESGKKIIESEYDRKRNAIHSVELKIKDDRRIHDDNLKLLHEIEMKISEISQNIEHLKERARNEFEIELELKTYPEDEWVDFASKREEVRQMKDRIRMLGPINFAAFDEYSSESERLTFLTQQRDDLIEAEKTLLNTIEEINNTAQKKFLETFSLIRENFIKTFKSLFDEGDECDLRLEEDEDPLEAGIEIIAKPRGKRPTSIDLLSGGEKTLTAIALLFAIYLVKPSPFCILDEVDAPLDDSNIDRFTRILKNFSDNTQFIVVTHNKRTMESANALYGVTMEEEGISKIVTVRFNEEAKVSSAAIATGV